MAQDQAQVPGTRADHVANHSRSFHFDTSYLPPIPFVFNFQHQYNNFEPRASFSPPEMHSGRMSEHLKGGTALFSTISTSEDHCDLGDI